MNRNRYIDRIYLEQSADGEHGRIASVADQGSQRAIDLGTVLASSSSEDFLEALIHHKGALDEWGGEIYISAIREKFDGGGNRIEHREVGEYLTVGYVVHYGHRSSVKGQIQEPDTPLATAQKPEPQPEPAEVENGVPVEA